MSDQTAPASVEHVLYVWSRGDGRFGGRILHGAVVQGHYEECTSSEAVRDLAVAFGKRVDRVEQVDAVPWDEIGGAPSILRPRGAPAESLEAGLINCILQLNTGQRNRLLNQIAALPLEARAQFVEHCNDLAAAVTRTMAA